MTHALLNDIIMTNSWSFMFDELTMTNQDFWEEDGISLTGNPGAAASDSITFIKGNPPYSSDTDTLTLSS